MDMVKSKSLITLIVVVAVSVFAASVYADEESTRNVLKQGLLGAGTGAIAASASGGKAGQGALIGAGTGVIGSALLDAVTEPSSSPRRRRAAPPSEDEYYDDDSGEYYYEEPPQESGTSKILKQGLLGAGTGAIAAGASGGDAGKGALIGAGTSVIGSALLDTISQPQSQRRGRVYRKIPRQKTQVQEEEAATEAGRKKIIRKYDENGKVVSEEEIYY